MKKAGDLTPQIGRQKLSEYRPECHTDAPDEGRNKQLADWYMRVMTGIYGQDLMIRKYPNDEALALGRRAIIRALRDLSPGSLLYGERVLEKDPGTYPKNPGEFAKLCQRAPEHEAFHVKQLERKASPESARNWIRVIKEKLREKVEP